MEANDLVQQLSEGFVPDDTFMFGPQSMIDMDHVQAFARSKGSLSFDGVYIKFSMLLSKIVKQWVEVLCLRPDSSFTHTVYKYQSLMHLSLMLQDFPSDSSGDDDVTSESSVADFTNFIPKLPASPSMSHIISIGQLLESVTPFFYFPSLIYACYSIRLFIRFIRSK